MAHKNRPNDGVEKSEPRGEREAIPDSANDPEGVEQGHFEPGQLSSGGREEASTGEEDSDAQHTCFYCGGEGGDGAVYELNMHHLKRGMLMTFGVPRCKRCEGRQKAGLLWLGIPGLVLLVLGVLFAKSAGSLATLSGVICVVTILSGLGLMFMAIKLWPKIAQKWWGVPPEEHAQQYPKALALIEEGFVFGPWPGDAKNQ